MPRKKADAPSLGTPQEGKPNALAVLVGGIIETFGDIAKVQQTDPDERKSQVVDLLRGVLVGPALTIGLLWIERERKLANEYARLLVERDRLISGIVDDANEPRGGDPI